MLIGLYRDNAKETIEILWRLIDDILFTLKDSSKDVLYNNFYILIFLIRENGIYKGQQFLKFMFKQVLF